MLFINKISNHRFNSVAKYIACLFILLCLKKEKIIAQTTDSAQIKQKEKVVKYDYYRVGVDVSKFVLSPLSENFNTYEFTFDAHYKKDIFWVADFGFGNSKIDNKNITFHSNNTFVRIGVDKTFFNQEFKGDMDNAFIGLRYGIGFVNRSAATYYVQDTVWGNTAGNIDKASFAAQWVELGGGFKMEIVKNIFLGWNIRVKTFINPKKFEKLPPAYIAGYGVAEKNTAFGYNLFLLYGFGKKR